MSNQRKEKKKKVLPKVQWKESYFWYCDKGHENEEAFGFEGMEVSCENCHKLYKFE